MYDAEPKPHTQYAQELMEDEYGVASELGPEPPCCQCSAPSISEGVPLHPRLVPSSLSPLCPLFPLTVSRVIAIPPFSLSSCRPVSRSVLALPLSASSFIRIRYSKSFFYRDPTFPRSFFSYSFVFTILGRQYGGAREGRCGCHYNSYARVSQLHPWREGSHLILLCLLISPRFSSKLTK